LTSIKSIQKSYGYAESYFTIKNTENSEDLKALANNDNDIVNTGIQLFGVAF
jgi:hypothetical protein